MPKDHLKPPRVRTLGANTTLSGFGQENMEKVYSDAGTYVVANLTKILIVHLNIHAWCCHTYVLLNALTVPLMINRRLRSQVSRRSALQAFGLMRMACLTTMMKGGQKGSSALLQPPILSVISLLCQKMRLSWFNIGIAWRLYFSA